MRQLEEFTYTEMFAGAYFLAVSAHRGQKDKAGEDYIEHSKRVAEKFNSYIIKTIAILHDVLEDTWVTEEMLRNMFPERIVDAVVYLTRKEGESYKQYIERMCEPRKTHYDESGYWAREVKIADLTDNMDLGRLKTITDEDFNRVKKYAKWREYLIKQQHNVDACLGSGRLYKYDLE